MFPIFLKSFLYNNIDAITCIYKLPPCNSELVIENLESYINLYCSQKNGNFNWGLID